MGDDLIAILLRPQVKDALERQLVETLPRQRWFRSKAREIRAVALVDAFRLAPGAGLVVIDVDFRSGPLERYCLPLAAVASDEEARARSCPVVCGVGTSDVVFCDPLAEQAFAAALLDLIAGAGESASAWTGGGALLATRGSRFAELRGDEPTLRSRSVGAEQSNTSVIYGDRLILKLFRKLEEGLNPDVEIGRHLTEVAGFKFAPPVAGALEYRSPGREAASVALLQQLVPNQGDAWSHALATLRGYFGQLPPGSEAAAIDNLAIAKRLVESYRPDAERLGRRTAELHAALAAAGLDPAFAPEPFDAAAAAALAASAERELSDTLGLLASRSESLSPAGADMARRVLDGRERLAARLRAITSRPLTSQRIRCHGDYHLGQALFTGADYVILDFEGEPARPLAERRSKQSPLKDVAGMLRSFEYAAAVAIRGVMAENPAADPTTLAIWAQPWRERVRDLYLRGYRDELRDAPFMPRTAEEFSLLLDVHVIEKSLYELRYEVNNRPDWVEIPLAALAELAT